LGDVAVSYPSNGHGGVFQYDFGKTIQDRKFEHTAILNQPPELLRATVTALRADYEFKGHSLQHVIEAALVKNKRLRKRYSKPDKDTDVLYVSEFTHGERGQECSKVCRDGMVIVRKERTDEDDDPAIHYGIIASANQVMKDATLRDALAHDPGVLCFEMEAAGLMNRFPCLVIRGICDYCDTHKNDDWHGYAAMTAAAFAKDFVTRIPPGIVATEQAAVDVLSSQLSGQSRSTLA
jgi:nucleoside phosphorylase